MKNSQQRPTVPLEGIIYGQISAWITISGLVVSIIGLLISFVYGGDILNENNLLRDLFSGKSESIIWARDSIFSKMPQHYWFFKQRLNGDEISMIGLLIACYGGVVGVWSLLASMFRSKKVLLYKKGFYTILAVIVTSIITLSAFGILAIR